MKLLKNINIETKRLYIATLTKSSDIDNYISWMKDTSNIFISSINPDISRVDLYDFIQEKYDDPFSILLGIYDRKTKTHIGNGKFEPINYDKKFAVVGILIGNPAFRGLGVAGEFIHECFNQICIPEGITELRLGVNKKNSAALSAYKKVGFVESAQPRLKSAPGAIEMVLRSAQSEI